MTNNTVAALYVDPKGPYPRLNRQSAELGADGHVVWLDRGDSVVDCWDAERDARKYDGPHPVVAHPPCGPWSRLRHRYKGNEHDCAPRAVEQVRKFGGVLEHPAASRLWEHPFYGNAGHEADCFIEKLPTFDGTEDSFGGYAIEVDQVEWGHVARKRTWLYLVGIPRTRLEEPPFPGRQPTHRCGSTTIGRPDGTRYRPASGLKSASAAQCRRTPPLFAEYLIRLARAAGRDY